MKRLAIVLVFLVVAGGLAVALLARSVLTGENVRAALASQVSAALGQPVTIGGLDASIYPRVTMDLADVRIGSTSAVHLDAVHIGVALRALLSRRIENAAVRVDGARITLPLPSFAIAQDPDAAASSEDRSLPVEIASIDEIVLRDVEVVHGDRRLGGDIELVPKGGGVDLRRLSLTIDDTRIDATGSLTSLAPLEGRVEATANAVDFDRLLAFLGDFTDVTPGAGAPAPAPTGGTAGALTVDLTLGHATSGGLSLSNVRTTALVTPEAVALDPVAFEVFEGRYEGSMRVTVGDTPRYRWRGKVSGIDTAKLMAFAGAANSISGRLSGTVSLDGAGLDVEGALRTARGDARIDITDGAIAGLALVRTIVVAASGRGGYVASAGTAIQSPGDAAAERFSRLGVTLSFADGLLTTRDFAMTATDVDLTGAGTIRLQSMATRLDGQVRLSESISKQAGSDLYRYAQEGGRVTLPATVSGPIDGLTVQIDLGQAAQRAIRNRAVEEAEKAIERNLKGGLKSLLPKRPPLR
ncbi:MAG TPA: AsmA family protein [Vicinamibacterales bacterium]|nr:AsmA family protein [Vicinamibacterales bacterium]